MKTQLSQKTGKQWAYFLTILALTLLSKDQFAIPTSATDIEFDPATNAFRVVCQEGGNIGNCEEIDLSPYQFFWKFGSCAYSFDQEPSYTFKEGEQQDVSVSLSRINIYDEEYGPSKIGFSKSFSGLNTELPPPAISNGLLDLDLAASGNIRGRFQSVIVVEYENRTQFTLNNAEITIALSTVLNPAVTVQSCCGNVTYTRSMQAGKDVLAFQVPSLQVNERCNLYLIYQVPEAFTNRVNEVIDIKANSFINFGPDIKKQSTNSSVRLNRLAASRVPSDEAAISLKVTEPFDPNSKIAHPSGCIGEIEEIHYTISFLNEGTANTNIIDIFDTLPAELNASTVHFETLELLGIDQNVNAPSVRFERFNNVLHWEFPANLPPDPGSDDAQGFIRFSVEPNQGLPEDTELANAATIVFDKGQGIRTNAMVHKVNCKTDVSATGSQHTISLMLKLLITIVILLVVVLLLQVIILVKS